MLPAGLLSYGQLPLPAVPAELTSTAARADYVAAHFYDAMDWADPSMTAEDAQTQAWADILSILPYTTSGTDSAAVARLFGTVPAEYVALYAELAEAYLLSADSEMVSERLYTAALTALTERDDLSATEKATHQARLDYLKQNAPGTRATDFAFEAPDGATVSLNDYVGKAPFLLVVFHDPECDTCHEIIRTLTTDPYWVGLQSSGTLGIITPEITDELDEAFRMLYTPSLYLLDSEGRVIVRNVLLDKISDELERVR